MNSHHLKRFDAFDTHKVLQRAGVYAYFKTFNSGSDTVVNYDGRQILMFGSNSYLGLAQHPRLKEAAIDAIIKYGTSSSGSRLLNGTLDIHTKLEERLSDFLGFDKCLVYGAGFMANLGGIAPLAGRGDVIFIDESVHASIIDGTRLGFAQVIKYKHNDVEDLEVKIRRTQARGPVKALMIIVDGVYSMEGDVAPLLALSEIAEKYGATFYVDDSHGLGVLGTHGEGSPAHQGVADKVDVHMGTFSKSVASIGGFVGGSEELIDYLKHAGRAMLFSASMPPASAATALEAINVMAEEPERVERLWSNINYAQQLLVQAGFEVGTPKSAVLPIYIRKEELTCKMANRLVELGLYVNPVVAPAVKPEHTLLRYSLMATHTKTQIHQSVEILVKCAKEVGFFSAEMQENAARVLAKRA